MRKTSLRQSGQRKIIKDIHPELDQRFYDTAFEDYQDFMKTIRLATTHRHQELLAAQSIVGHAIEGHKKFAEAKPTEIIRHRYPNATINDVYEAILRKNPGFAQGPAAVRAERQGMIRSLKGWIDEVVKGTPKKYNPRRLLEPNGEPLMGIEYFRHRGQLKNPMSVILGIYLGSMLDSQDWREQAQDYFSTMFGMNDFAIHRGLCTAGYKPKMDAAGITIEDLASWAYKPKIPGFSLDELLDEGLLVDFRRDKSLRKKGVPNAEPYVPVYLELASGYGVSDDAALLYISMLYGEEAGLGFMLIDAVDTVDKCAEYIRERGEDELIGVNIKSKLDKHRGIELALGISQQDVINMIFAAAIDVHNPEVWPSCSQRRFLQYDGHGNYALWSHLNLVRCLAHGQIPPPDNISL